MKTKFQSFATALFLISISAGLFEAKAVNPPPDGGYPNGNTAEGTAAMLSLTNGGYNTAVGFLSLRNDMSGSFNTGVGAGALLANAADGNTAIGTGALLSNTTANENTASGTLALFSNTTGAQNTAFGYSALFSNTTAGANSSGANTAVGAFALGTNVTGGANTAIGYATLYNANGGSNIAVGDLAGFDVIAGNSNILIGNHGSAADDATIRIGNTAQSKCYITGIRGTTTGMGDAVPVVVDSAHQLGTVSSSKRFKKEIKPMENASEAVLALKPVTFQYKNDTTGRAQFGLIAEQVAEVNPDLVVRDDEGKIYTVRYDAVNAMLLNEFLKEHRKVEKLEATVADLATELRQVKSQLSTNRSTLRVAARNP